MQIREFRLFWAGAAFGAALAVLIGAALSGVAFAERKPGAKAPQKDNAELTKLFTEDQADRMPQDGKPIDWSVVGPRDKAREARVKEMYTTDSLHSGKDFYHAAMVLQHASQPEDYLLAHEMCVVAISRGSADARWLAAASEDRFLMNVNRPQRFGTQYKAQGTAPDAIQWKLYDVDSSVTDSLRRALNVPTLDEAHQREAMMNKKPGSK